MAKRKTPIRRRAKSEPTRLAQRRRFAFGGPVVLLILCALLVAGVASRVHLLDRSLWLDEAWVANSILASSLRGALYYDAWLQTTPPLFIVLARFFTDLFGTSNTALRALPAFSGIIAVFLLSFLAFRLLKPSFALLAILLFVLSPRVILYSQSVKPYSSDVLATIGLLALGHVYLEKRSDRWFYGLLAGNAVLSFLSYTAMFFFPFVVYCAFTRRKEQPQVKDAQTTTRADWQRPVSAIATMVFVCATNYFFFIAPNKNSALIEFFPEGFNAASNPAEFLIFYGDKFSTLTGVFFFGGPGALRILALLITVLGLFRLWAPLKDSLNVESFDTAILFSMPFVGVLALNILKVFPLPSFQHRVLLFVFPATVILFCLGLQMSASLAARVCAAKFRGVKATTVENTIGSLVLFAMAGLVWLFFNTIGLMPFFAEEHEDSEQAVAYLRERVQADDVLFVHATMREQFKLYTRTEPVPAQRILYGKVGMPCCPRHDYRSPRQESEQDIADEVAAVSVAATGRRLWVLITNRALHWYHIQRNDITVIERILASKDCQKLAGENFTGVYVAGFGCQQR